MRRLLSLAALLLHLLLNLVHAKDGETCLQDPNAVYNVFPACARNCIGCECAICTSDTAGDECRADQSSKCGGWSQFTMAHSCSPFCCTAKEGDVIDWVWGCVLGVCSQQDAQQALETWLLGCESAGTPVGSELILRYSVSGSDTGGETSSATNNQPAQTSTPVDTGTKGEWELPEQQEVDEAPVVETSSQQSTESSVISQDNRGTSTVSTIPREDISTDPTFSQATTGTPRDPETGTISTETDTNGGALPTDQTSGKEEDREDDPASGSQEEDGGGGIDGGVLAGILSAVFGLIAIIIAILAWCFPQPTKQFARRMMCFGSKRQTPGRQGDGVTQVLAP